MYENETLCPNCGAIIKESLVGRNVLCKPLETLIINEFFVKKTEAYCGKCAPTLLKEASERLREEKINLVVAVARLAESILILTVENPPGWQFTCLGPATAQSTTGKGPLLELENSAVSFFGSGNENKHLKIKLAEERVFSQLRKKCIEADCNAIVGAKVDYHILDGEKGGLLITVSGTMVKVSNMAEVDKPRFDFLEMLNIKYNRLGYLITLLRA
jgi:uncharacterized protein YbjQ (UPF0145 family)